MCFQTFLLAPQRHAHRALCTLQDCLRISSGLFGQSGVFLEACNKHRLYTREVVVAVEFDIKLP